MLLSSSEYDRTKAHLANVERDYIKIKIAQHKLNTAKIKEDDPQMREFLMKHQAINAVAVNKLIALQEDKFIDEIERCRIKIKNIERYDKLVPEIIQIVKPYKEKFEKIGFKVRILNKNSCFGSHGEILKCLTVYLDQFFCSFEAKIDVVGSNEIEYGLMYIISEHEDDTNEYKKIQKITKNLKTQENKNLQKLIETYIINLEKFWINN